MTQEEFITKTKGIQAGRLADLLGCSRFSVDRYRTGAPIPAKISRRVEELYRILDEFRKTNFINEDK